MRADDLMPTAGERTHRFPSPLAGEGGEVEHSGTEPGEGGSDRTSFAKKPPHPPSPSRGEGSLIG
jgi:hypothetical protein